MPHKDPEARRAYNRARNARLKAEDPEAVAKRAAYLAAYHQKKKREDETYEARRKEQHRKWYEEHGKDNARSRKGYIPFEEWSEQQNQKRLKSLAAKRKWSKTEAGQRAMAKRSVMRRCGLSIDEYDRIYDEQGGKCKICRVEKPRYGQYRLVVDHCHMSGEFRALLCGKCNSAIGFLGENEETLFNAIEYLESFRKKTG